MDKGKLAFLVGLPRSGKSTIGNLWREGKLQFGSNRRASDIYANSRVIVRADNIRLAMGFRYNENLEGFVDATKHIMIKTLLYEHDILVDGTHTTRSSLLKLLNIDNSAEFYFVDTPPSICEQRARETGQPDLIPVINRLTDNLFKLAEVDHWDDLPDALPLAINTIRLMAVDEYAYKPLYKR